MKNLKILPILISPFLSTIHAQFSYKDPCLTNPAQQTCSSCIQSHRSCLWTPQNPESKCSSTENRLDTDKYAYREKTYIKYNPSNPVSRKSKNTHMSPETVFTKIRPGDEDSFEITFDTEKENPLDVYFLLDLTQSMNSVISELKDSVAEVVQKIIDNTPSQDTIRIGIGGFQEKPTAPFQDENTDKDPEVFQNWMSLVKTGDFVSNLNTDPAIGKLKSILDEFQAKNGKKFKNLVTNADNEEAGLEALVQTAVCSENIGWAKKSRHVVIFITDAKSHVAGDGKYAGILIPNELTCKMKKLGKIGQQPAQATPLHKYTGALAQDYPSPNDLKLILASTNVQTMFLNYQRSDLEKRTTKFYESLVNILGDEHKSDYFTSATELESAVVGLYKKITKNVILVPDKTNEELTGFAYRIDAKCGSDSFARDQNFCKKSGTSSEKFKAPVSFLVTVKLDTNPNNTCPKTQTINFHIPGFGGKSDQTSLTLESYCNCECAGEKILCETDRANPHGLQCSGNGERSCGICQCETGFIGDCCECDKKDTSKHHQCRKEVNSDICSGNGECFCGKCHCREGYSGDFCENSCQDSACVDPENNSVCNGRGSCDCSEGSRGVCDCKYGFAGKYCECGSDDCMTEKGWNGSDDLCWGQGECRCQKTQKNVGNGGNGENGENGENDGKMMKNGISNKTSLFTGKCNCDQSTRGESSKSGLWNFFDTGFDNSDYKCQKLAIDCDRIKEVCDVDGKLDCRLAGKLKELDYSLTEELAWQETDIENANICMDKSDVCLDSKDYESVYRLTEFFVDMSPKFDNSNFNLPNLLFRQTEKLCYPPGPNYLMIMIISIGLTLIAGLLIIIVMKIIVLYLDKKDDNELHGKKAMGKIQQTVYLEHSTGTMKSEKAGSEARTRRLESYDSTGFGEREGLTQRKMLG